MVRSVYLVHLAMGYREAHLFVASDLGQLAVLLEPLPIAALDLSMLHNPHVAAGMALMRLKPDMAHATREPHGGCQKQTMLVPVLSWDPGAWECTCKGPGGQARGPGRGAAARSWPGACGLPPHDSMHMAPAGIEWGGEWAWGRQLCWWEVGLGRRWAFMLCMFFQAVWFV